MTFPFCLTLVVLLACCVQLRAQDDATGLRIDPQHFTAITERISDGILTESERLDLIKRGVDESALKQLVSMMRARPLGPPAGVPVLQLPIRSPMTEGEFRCMLVLLKVSEAQRIYLEGEYARYADASVDAWRTETAAIWSKSAEAAVLDAASPDRARLFGDLVDEAEKVDQRLATHDATFFATVQTVLSHDQNMGLDRARMLRQRVAAKPGGDWYAGADVDLLQLYLPLLMSHPLETDAIDQRFEQVMAEYERRLTQLVLELRRECWKTEVDRVSSLVTQTRSIEANEALVLREQHRALGRKPVRIGKDIHDLHVATLNQVLPLLPAAGAARLREAFRDRAYPIVYPIDRAVVNLIDGFLAKPVPDAAPQARDILPVLRSDLEMELEAAAEHMARRYVVWKAEVAELGGFEHPKYRAYQRDMLDLLTRQHHAMIRTLNVVAGIVPEHTRMIEEIRAMLNEKFAARSNTTSGRGFGWPDPYGDYHAPH